MAARFPHRLPGFVLAWMLAFLLTPALAAACDTTFDGSTNNTWEDPTNWSNGVPTSSNLACIPAPLAPIVTTAQNPGAITLDSGASLEIGTGASMTVGGGSLGVSTVLDGTLIFTGGELLLDSSVTTISSNVNGSGGGQLKVQPNRQVVFANGADLTGGGVTVTVLGMLSIAGSTGANPTIFDGVLNNNGVITNDGPVNVIGGGSGSGTWKLGSGTGPDEPIVTIGISNYSMDGDFTDADSGGLGHLKIDSGLTMVGTGLAAPHITVDRLDLTNANAGLDFSPLPAGDAAVKVGSLNLGNAAGLFEVDASLEAQTVEMPMGNMLVNGDWQFGQFRWGGGDISTGSGSTLTVGALDMNFVAGDIGSRTLSGGVRLLMSGSVSPTYAGGVGTSTFTINATSKLEVGPGAEFSFGDDLDILGTGSVVNHGIIRKVSGSPTGGSRIQPPLITSDGQLRVDAGQALRLDVPPDTFDAGTNTLSGDYVLNGELVIPATINVLAGSSQIGSGGTITQTLGGTSIFDTLTATNPGSTMTVTNPVAFTQNFTNQGTLDIGGGGLFQVAVGKAYTAAAGSTTKLSGPSAQLVVDQPIALPAGATLSGVGQVFTPTLTNSGGTVSPGNSPGTLTINGDYVQSGTGLMYEEIDGPSAGQFDKLVVTGTATLGGTLALASTNGYQAPDTTQFQIVDAAGGVIGTWDGILQSPFAPYFEAVYAPNTMVLIANSVSIGDVTVNEGNSGTTDAVFTISLGQASTGPVSVDWATQDGTAVAGSDYTAASGTVTFAPGETTKTVAVAVTGDIDVEPTENFAVNLSNPVGTRIRDANGVGTIVNDDSPPQAVIAQVPPGDIDGLAIAPPPIQGKAVNVEPVKGTVLVKLPGKTKYVTLPDAEQVPVGTIVDARKGTVRLFSVGTGGRVQSALFYEGIFQVTQKPGQALTELVLVGGSFTGCPKVHRASAAVKRKKPTASVRHLWGSGSGQFRTRGRYASATIRGTKWLTDDRCNGTLIRVTVGSVTVRDLTLRKSVVVKKPKSYLAPAVKPKKKKG